jgi:hypothetical protein
LNPITATKEVASPMATMNPMTARLTRLFGDLNQQFFRGRVDVARPVGVASPPAEVL